MKSNENLKVVFDIDGTLIHITGENEDTPRYDVVSIFKHFESLGCDMYAHSGGGIDYCQRWIDKLGLNAKVVMKGSLKADIAFDDEEVKLASVNVRV